MSREKFKKLLKDAYLEIRFDYNGKTTFVSPLGSGKYDFMYGEDVEHNDIAFDELITTPFFNGKTILDIVDDITELEEI